jgi:hypothetical protein
VTALSDALAATQTRASRILVTTVHNRLYWPIARRIVRVVDFGDGTYALGWRWSKRSWLAS